MHKPETTNRSFTHNRGCIKPGTLHLTDRAAQARHDTIFPWRTCTVNMVGSLIHGLVAGSLTAGTASGVPHQLQVLIGTDFCGTLTTYSTLSYETLRLIEQRARFYATANIAVSIVSAPGGVFFGAAVWTKPTLPTSRDGERRPVGV